MEHEAGGDPSASHANVIPKLETIFYLSQCIYVCVEVCASGKKHVTLEACPASVTTLRESAAGELICLGEEEAGVVAVPGLRSSA